MPSLTHHEARERAALITVHNTDVTLDLSAQEGPGEREFGSVTKINFSAVPGSDTFLDFNGIRLNAAVLNGRRLDAADWSDGRIALTDLAAENEMIVDAVMGYSQDGEGLHRHVDPADGNVYLYAMSFLDAAPRWFACFDQPDLKCRYRFQVTAPADWTVHGNGPATADGAGRWTIVPTEPLSTYFTTLIAGPYASIYHEHDGIGLGIHVRASLGESLQREADDILTVTGQCFDYYHRIFGRRYPFGEYHQAFVPDFNAGAMENPGCVTFRDSFIYRSRATRAERASRAGVIAHEMAHQWFGDLVTMRWWDDLWLNESFAEYLAQRCCTDGTEYPAWTEFGIVRKAWGYVIDQSAATHPVAGNGAKDAQSALANFDGISYAKGAAVLRQLAGYLGDEVFLAGLRQYFDQHAFGNAEFAELIEAWTAAGGVDLDHWTKQWLLTAGLDTLWLRTSDGTPELTRVVPSDRPADRSHTVHVAGIADTGAVLDPTRTVLGAAGCAVSRPEGAVAVIPDVFDETWAKIRFEPEDWTALSSRVGRIDQPGARVVIWNSMVDQVRDAELDPDQALQMIIDQLPAEPDDTVLATLLRFGQRTLIGRFVPVAERAGRIAQLHRLAMSVLDSAEPASDRQLTAFRSAIHSCDDPDQLDRWRQRRDLPPGVDLDLDLSWSIVTRICFLADRPEVIESALKQDTSAAARVNAARARAALPTAAAKQRAYTILTEPSELSAYEVYATAEALFGDSAEQVALTRGHAERYCADISSSTRFRSGWSLNRVATLGFPGAVTEAAVLAAAEAVMAAESTPESIARVIAEEIDPLRRALAAQRRFFRTPE